MKLRVRCRDKYEAQKLVSLIYRDDDNDTFVTKILNVIENEVVVSLKDKSAHSVLLKDSQNVEACPCSYYTPSVLSHPLQTTVAYPFHHKEIHVGWA